MTEAKQDAALLVAAQNYRVVKRLSVGTYSGSASSCEIFVVQKYVDEKWIDAPHRGGFQLDAAIRYAKLLIEAEAVGDVPVWVWP